MEGQPSTAKTKEIMTEMKKRYEELYNKMATSKNVSDMHAFGSAATEMFDWIEKNSPSKAREVLSKLESIEWSQYLSEQEARKIYSSLRPMPIWDYQTLMSVLKNEGLMVEEKPYFNSYALWVVISAQYSDIGENIAKAMGKELATVDTKALAKELYNIAVKYLKDADGIYNVRKYFSEIIDGE